MFKLIFSVFCIYLSSLFRVECLFAGDGCYAEGQSGICTYLEKCHHIARMVKDGGSPMPPYVRDKLRSLACGFNFNEQMICCISSGDTGTHQIPSDEDRAGETSSHHFANADKDRYIWGYSGNPNSNGNTFNKPSPEFNGLGNPEDKNGNDLGNNGDLPDIQNHRNLKLLPDFCGNIDGDRILGGKRTALFEMPWMVLISYYTGRRTEQNCGGTLISEYYVLTAAHCVSFLRKGTTLNGVILGEHDINQDPDCTISFKKKYCAPNIVNATIEQVIPHPGFSPDTMFDDIALLRLSAPVDFDSASTRPICLPTTPELQRESLIGKNVTIAGWGLTDDRIQSSVLLSALLPVLNNDLCQKAYKRTIRVTEKQICAGGIEDLDSCNGDSGGPLMFAGVLGNSGTRYIQRGIISFGSLRCGVKDSPTVYTNVAYYMDWILNNISN